MNLIKFVFVTVGTTDFDDLVKTVDNIIPSLPYKAEAQIGHGFYEPVNIPFFRFSPSIENYYSKADLIIAHGGFGTTIEILERGIPLISVSNRDRYDNHQDDLLAEMENEGYLVWCRSLEKLKETLEIAMNKKFERYTPPECRIHKIIEQFLIDL
jgi:UDP-N-acetylglucosamine transferase subunit ALG13